MYRHSLAFLKNLRGHKTMSVSVLSALQNKVEKTTCLCIVRESIEEQGGKRKMGGLEKWPVNGDKNTSMMFGVRGETN
jgi:hypothetical protein